MRRWRETTWVLVPWRALVLAVLAIVGCGSTRTVTTTSTATLSLTSTTTSISTVIHYRQQAPTSTVVQTTTTTQAAAIPSGLSFSGNGGENIGTIHVPSNSVVHWTDDGGVFQILDVSEGFTINSQGSSGVSDLPAGTYHNIYVNALGNWTIKIVPQG